jgi:hypothetical protein
MPLLIGLGAVVVVLVILAVSSPASRPTPAPPHQVTLAAGMQTIAVDQGTSIAVALPPGASWVSLTPVNKPAIAVQGNGLLHVVATESGTVTGIYKDASGQTVTATVQVLARGLGS